MQQHIERQRERMRELETRVCQCRWCQTSATQVFQSQPVPPQAPPQTKTISPPPTPQLQVGDKVVYDDGTIWSILYVDVLGTGFLLQAHKTLRCVSPGDLYAQPITGYQSVNMTAPSYDPADFPWRPWSDDDTAALADEVAKETVAHCDPLHVCADHVTDVGFMHPKLVCIICDKDMTEGG